MGSSSQVEKSNGHRQIHVVKTSGHSLDFIFSFNQEAGESAGSEDREVV